MPPLGVFVRLNALRRRPVDHTQNPSSLLRLRDEHFHRVRSRAEDIHNLRNILNAAEDIDREAIRHHDHKAMPGSHGLGIHHSKTLQRLVIAIDADQTRSRCFIERNPELHLRRRVHDRLIDVLNCLDEVTRADNNISAFRYRQADRADLHAYNCMRGKAHRRGF